MNPTEVAADPANKGSAQGSHRTRRRAMIERSWVIGIILFTLGRFAVAYGTLERYGLNVWVFGLIDLGTAVPYGVSTARLVGAVVDRKFQSAARWGVMASITFLAPYLYVAWAGREVGFPPIVYAVLGVLIVCFGLNAAFGVTRRVRETRIAASATSSP